MVKIKQRKQRLWLFSSGAVLLGTLWLFQWALGQAETVLPSTDFSFSQAAPQGFGDRQNTYTWSMAWWRGHLYVGTGRSTQCVQQATGHLFYPSLVAYPPVDPDIECTLSPQDLPLRAEIWRWTPGKDTWERLFQSPQDVPIPDFPGKFVARDIGFRSMTVFREADGTEALYVGGVSSNTFNPDVPPPRILRSTDGLHFDPVPQDPGTFLGDIEAASFRSLTSFSGKLYVIATVGYAGFGHVLEAANPAQGNNGFQLALAEEITAFELNPFNNALYIGTGDSVFAYPPDPDTPPFDVLKISAEGAPPYQPTTVIAEGGYRISSPSRSVVSMQVFQGRLYVGTDRPAELYRINPDDTWDLIVGTARWTPIGIKYPLSGMDVGFDNPNNIHIWRMHEYQNQLLVGTMDQSTKWRDVPVLGESLRPTMGFDLYVSGNGRDFAMITRNGFNDIFDVGVRNFATTSHGLFFGTANQYYGTKLWHAPLLTGDVFSLFLPLVVRNGANLSLANVPEERAGAETISSQASQAFPTVVGPPSEISVTERHNQALLAWDAAPGADQYHVWRAEFIPGERLPSIPPEFDAVIARPFRQIGTTRERFFVDGSVEPGIVYHYFLVAEAEAGAISHPSYLIRYPSLALTRPLLVTGGPQDSKALLWGNRR